VRKDKEEARARRRGTTRMRGRDEESKKSGRQENDGKEKGAILHAQTTNERMKFYLGEKRGKCHWETSSSQRGKTM